MTTARSALSNIMQLGIPAAAAFELVAQVLAGIGNAQRLINAGMDAALAGFVVSAIADAVSAGRTADISFVISLIIEFLKQLATGGAGLGVLGFGTLGVQGLGAIGIRM